jgi:Holliday junction resolvasome RuvABC endonuclease subunit
VKALGLDLSLTGTAWRSGLGDEHRGRWDTPADKIAGQKRLTYLRDLIAEVVWQETPDIVLIEGYSYASPNGAHQAGELGGVIRTMLTDWLIPWTTVTPQNRAKLATGNGSAKKAAVVSALSARTGLNFPTDDDADAFTLWCMALEAYDQEHPLRPLPKLNLAAMVTVDWPRTETLTPVYEYKPKPHGSKAKKAAA